MDADKKLGLALGILLCGIVGAFFFRDEAEPSDDKLQLADASKLDDQIRQMAQTPYLPDAQSTGLTEVSDALASDVIPRFPDRDAEPPIIPQPIRPGVSQRSDIDLVAPIPSASGDEHLDAAFDRANLTNGVPPIRDGERTKPRLSQNAPPSRDTNKLTKTKVNWITHEVVEGDTLSEISSKYLGTHRRYNEIYKYNKDVLKSPNDIRLGMKLRIPVGQQSGAQSASDKSTTPSSPGVRTQRKGNLFVRPPRSPLSTVPRVTLAPGGSLSQTPPPDVPHVEGLLDPTIIATRLKADRTQSKTEKTARD
jgi:LysM repeat protein